MTLQVTANEQQVDVYRGDLVNDTIVTSVGTVPFEWTTGFTREAAVAAIEAYLDGAPLEAESTGEGWIIDLDSDTHPQAEITDVDYVTGLINFRWREAKYSGDCAIQFALTLGATPDEIAAAIEELLP